MSEKRHHPRMGGRPSKLTREIQDKIVAAIRVGNYAQVAAKYAGIGETTFYAWLKRGEEESQGKYQEFQEAVKRAESEAEVRTVALLHQHMQSSWQAGMTFLERKFPDRWGRTSRLKVDLDSRELLKQTLELSEADLNELLGTIERTK